MQTITDADATQDEAFSLAIADSFADEDAADNLTFSATADGAALPAWLQLDAQTGVFSGTPANADVGTLNITVVATDSAGASASDDFTLTIANVNDPPMVEDQSLSVSTDAQVGASAGFISANDPDVGDTLEFMVTGAPLDPTFSLDTMTGEITVEATDALVDGVMFPFDVQVTDSGNPLLSDTATVTITVRQNQPPIASPIADQTATEEVAFNLSVTDTFTDPENDVLTLAATLDDGTALPVWLTFDGTNATFSGTPTNDDTGELEIRVTATDTSTNQATSTFSLSISNVNDAPEASAIANSVTPEDALFDFDITPFFSDIDPGDTLTFTANLASGDPLPSWLAFSDEGQFSVTPTNDDVGSLSICLLYTSDAANE